MGIGAQVAAVTGPRRLGRYELIAKIAAGGMAEVFLARQHGPMGFHKVVVVKTIHEHLAEQQDFIDMFLDEARVSALIKHHNVVDIYDLGVEDGTYFIAMEYIPGQALSKVMSLCSRTGERLDAMLATDLIAAAAHGLEAAHNLKGITGKPLELVHRDVSPGNILVSYDGAVKLVDFGVAKSLGSISSSQSSVLKGKIGYASPEQLEDAGLDRRSDVFSLGVVLWELLVFERLFRGSSAAATVKKILDGNPPPPSSRRPEVPPELDEVCLKAMARDPADRYQTAGEMRSALLRVLQKRNYHSDNEVLATFMSESFANERAHETALIREIVADEIEVELFEVGREDEGEDLLVGTEDLEVDTELIEIGPDDGLLTLVAEHDSYDDDDDDDEPEITIEPDDVDFVLVDESDDALEPLIADGEERSVSSATDPVSPTSIKAHRKWLRPAAFATAAVLALALIAALLAGDGRAPQAAPAAEPPGAGPTPAPEATAPETKPDTTDTAPAASATSDDATADATEADGDSATGDEPDETAETPGDEPGDAPPKVANPRAEAARLAALGVRAFAGGQISTAKGHFKTALEYRENHPAALRGLALVYARTGRGKTARYYLNRYLRAVPNAKDAAQLKRRVYSSTR